MSERFLVTGALGCIGAWTVRVLVEEAVPVVAYDLGDDPHRLRLIMGPEELGRITLVRGDVTDLAALERTLDEHGITNVVHLAALQVPFCRADPVLGAQVNVAGTVAVFEAVKRRQARIGGLAYASSVAVYGERDEGAEDERPLPATHYGVYKLANEGTARIYWQDEGVPSIGLRPSVVYGPGRDQGITSTPTQAMLAAARGEGFHITFGGRTEYTYALDVARAFVAAGRAARDGAGVFNFPGVPAHMREVVAAIEAAAPEVAGRITYEERALPFPPDFSADGLTDAVGPLELTPFAEGVRQTVEHFRATAL